MLAHSSSRSYFQEKALITTVIYPLAHKETFIVSLTRSCCLFLKVFLSLLFRPFMLLCSQTLHSLFSGVCSDGMQTSTNVRNMVCLRWNITGLSSLIWFTGQVRWQCTIELPTHDIPKPFVWYRSKRGGLHGGCDPRWYVSLRMLLHVLLIPEGSQWDLRRLWHKV